MSYRALALLLLAPITAAAHSGHAVPTGFGSGWFHPLSGIDHLLALIGIGFWAALHSHHLRGFGVRIAVSLAALLAGLSLGLVVGAPLELGLAGSVGLLGALVLGAPRLAAGTSMALVAAFALLHGHAHGAEMGTGLVVAPYAAGLMTASAVLMGSGGAIAWLARRGDWCRPVERGFGGALLGASVYLLLAL